MDKIKLATSCKAGLEPKGLNFISELKSFDKEIYALGGLDGKNYKEAIKAGANGDIELIKKIVESKNS